MLPVGGSPGGRGGVSQWLGQLILDGISHLLVSGY